MDKQNDIMISDGISVRENVKAWESPLEAMRTLLSYPYINFVSQYFVRTREFESGLDFIECCYEIIVEYQDGITNEEAVRWDRYLTRTRLVLYDHLNMWPAYIDGFADMMQRYPDDDYALLLPILDRIKRKQERHAGNRKIGNVLRHSKGQLSPEECMMRFIEMMYLFERMGRPKPEPVGSTAPILVRKKK